MANQLSYKNPNTGKMRNIGVNLIPTMAMRYNGKEGFGDLDEPYLSLSGTKTSAAGSSESVNVSCSALEQYYMCVNGGEYVPHPSLQGKEAFLAADIAIDAVSMVVSKSTTKWKKTEENIFVADHPYLLMNRKPLPGEDVFKTGTEDGLICPAAEIIFVGAGYTSGTTVTIVRGTGAAARKKMAVIQALPGVWSSRADESEYAGLLFELERPDAVSLGDPTSPVATEIKVYFLPSVQQADTPNSNGEYGVVTHYGVWVLPMSALFKYNVRGLPENAAPSQYDDGGQVDAVLAIDDAAVVTEDVGGTDYLTIDGLNRAWNPETGALEALVSTEWYWVGVKAMNQGTFDANLRASNIPFNAIQVT